MKWLAGVLLCLFLATPAFAQPRPSTIPHSGVGQCTSGNVVSGLNVDAPPTCVANGGGGGGGGLPGVTVTNTPSGAGQNLNSTGTTTAAWQTPLNSLPAFGNAGSALFQDPTGTFPVWANCAGDVTCSAVTPGTYTVTKIQGNQVVPGVPGGDAYFYVWNQALAQFLAVPMNGDVTMSNTGRTTVSKLNGVSIGPLATQPIPCTVAQGCTGQTAAGPAAANAIGAAESGANTSITSLAGVTSINGTPTTFIQASAATVALTSYGGL